MRLPDFSFRNFYGFRVQRIRALVLELVLFVESTRRAIIFMAIHFQVAFSAYWTC